jgi:RimJ/RimL family protein N-acetyltransferase
MGNRHLTGHRTEPRADPTEPPKTRGRGPTVSVNAPIITERLLLRPYEMSDLDDILAIESDPEVARYLHWDTRTREETREALRARATCTRLGKDDDVLALAVERRDSGQVIGELTLWWRSVTDRQGEIGFIFNRQHHGQGFARESAEALLDLCFDHLALHRVYGRTHAGNIPSAALMRRLGMRQEAHFRHHQTFKGAWDDELLFAVLEDDWAQRGS